MLQDLQTQALGDSRERRLLVPYGEAALSADRLENLRGLLAKLQNEKINGTVVVTTYAGRFCLQKAADGFELAPIPAWHRAATWSVTRSTTARAAS